jgi:hypothetical protein
VEVETMILHKSGEYLAETLFMPVSKYDAHGVGSGITYARRYGLMSLLCLAADDDDGNAAVERAPAALAPVVKAAIQAGEVAARKQGEIGAANWWTSLNNDLRAAIPAEDKARIKQIGKDNNNAEEG